MAKHGISRVQGPGFELYTVDSGQITQHLQGSVTLSEKEDTNVTHLWGALNEELPVKHLACVMGLIDIIYY